MAPDYIMKINFASFMGHEIVFMTSSWGFHGVLTEWSLHSVSNLRHFVKMYGADDKPKERTVNTNYRMEATLGNFHANPKHVMVWMNFNVVVATFRMKNLS